MRTAFFTAVMIAVSLSHGAIAQEAPLRIIAFGDMPYGSPEEVYPPFERLIGEINARDPNLVIHVGDTKGGGPCTDEILTDQRDYMNSVAAPVLYTPGDNEWTDCHRAGDDPIERLGFIRQTYFDVPDQSLGQNPIAVVHQGDAGYPENTRVQMSGVGIVTAHVVGSNNGFEARTTADLDAFFARSAASTDWLEESFDAFSALDVIVVAIHADMFEFDFNSFEKERWLRHSGFGQFGEALKAQARRFGKPVLLVFGDSHRHVIFQPFPQSAPNVTAMEVYGFRDMHAVEISIAPGSPSPFVFETVWNPDLLEE